MPTSLRITMMCSFIYDKRIFTMKKSIFKTSLLVTLSTLFVACSSHNHTATDNATQKQPQTSKDPAPQTKPQANSQDKAQQDSKQEKPNNTEQSSSSSMQTENSTQNGSTKAEKEPKPSPPEQPMNTESTSDDKKDEMSNTDTSKHNSSKNTQSDMPDLMPNNHKPKENSLQMPPKIENSNNMGNKDKGKEKEKKNQTRNPPKPEEMPQGDMPPSPLPPGFPGQRDWEGKICLFNGHCLNSTQSPKNIPNSSIAPSGTISLQLGENKENGYQFDLLGEKSDEGSVYYGYRSYNSPYRDDETKKVYDIIQGINTSRVNNTNIPSHFNAEYKKDNGFLYIPFATLSAISEDKNTPHYADISIMYKNGKATGKVTKTGKADTILFDIKESEKNTTTSNYTLTITPTEKETKIQTKESAQFEVYFLDSATKGDRKYIAGRGVSSGKKWGGVFAAEKQNDKETSSSTRTE
ncbi:hypothetical protein K7G90_001270 [Pasteurella canis]|uniref:hypothetical protein n=1 Tax=Pasteurella canis TaxID=753 RepID=UPI001CC53F46|nr:hypothetical protein [Pasteurella canis]UAY77067.1 hypothetical protein K7G90_001270 [Pasteurella canis]